MARTPAGYTIGVPRGLCARRLLARLLLWLLLGWLGM